MWMRRVLELSIYSSYNKFIVSRTHLTRVLVGLGSARVEATDSHSCTSPLKAGCKQIIPLKYLGSAQLGSRRRRVRC